MYFKISFSKNLMAKTKEERNKITGINIYHGFYCLIAYKCPNGNKCKYRRANVFHNFSVNVHRWFEYKLKIKLPHLIYINKYSTDLSGTITCPYGMPREESCWRCKYGLGEKCGNEERNKLLNLKKWEETEHPTNKYICKFFERSEDFYNYDKVSGKFIFNSGGKNEHKNNC